MNTSGSYNKNQTEQHGQAGVHVRSFGMGSGAANAQPQAQNYSQPDFQNFGNAGANPYGVPHHSQVQGMPQGAPVPMGQYIPPATSIPIQPVKKKKPKRFWVAIAIVVLCVILAAVLFFTLGPTGKSSRQGSIGQLEGKTAEEIQAELDRIVDDGMFNISIASVVEFPSGTSEGELRIENVPGNQYLMRVVINRDDTGAQIYETDLIEPNYHIQADSLDVDLPAGTYPCTAVFYAYDPETEEMIGQAGAKIDIRVLS